MTPTALDLVKALNIIGDYSCNYKSDRRETLIERIALALAQERKEMLAISRVGIPIRFTITSPGDWEIIPGANSNEDVLRRVR